MTADLTLAPREIGATGVMIGALGVGGGPFGNLLGPVDPDEVRSVVNEALHLGVRYFDTAPVYGMGLSESRLGAALAGVDRSTFVLSTKVGRLLRAEAPPDPELHIDGEPFFKDTPPVNPIWDFSAKGVRRSLEESLDRLNLDHADIVLIHEPPDAHVRRAAGEGFRALRDLQRAGQVRAIGLGWDKVEPMIDFVRENRPDCVMVAGRYTLLDQRAAPVLLPLCAELGVAVIAAGVFNSGFLADTGATFEYAPANDAVREQAARVEAVCARHDVPLAAAALQFALRHAAVAGAVIGMRTRTELRQNLELLEVDIPEALWDDLARNGLITQ
jgi:D-threo-aldose 1-dehydrogenase